MNYYNTLPQRIKLEELGTCRFMSKDEFNGVEKLKGKKIVIVGCGAQGLNQGLNLRDSGLDVSYAFVVQQLNRNASHLSMQLRMVSMLVLTKSLFLLRIS